MVEFFDASPKSMARSHGNRFSDINYPFEELLIGKCFIVPHTAIKIGSLRNKATMMGKKLGRRFTVVDYGERGYEVARIAMKNDPIQIVNKNK